MYIVGRKSKWHLFQGLVVENPVVINVTAQNYDWLPEVQTAISNNSKHHIILVAQDELLNDIMGLMNCIRKEPGSGFVRLETSCLNLFAIGEENITY
jgi:hypothetical protein